MSARRSILILGLAFLYAPLALLVLYSFNGGRLVSVWSGFSTRWYAALFANERLLDAAWLSLEVAAISATLATTLGAAAGVALARLGRFPFRSLLALLVAAPLVMPEVINGLSLLLTFVALEGAIGWPGERGLPTLVVAHATFSVAYVAVIVQARLADFDSSIEEAAADLGAPPASVFFHVTLPLVSPALAAGWLLAFTLSLDDLVVASFVSGPGATTLPMYIFSSLRLGLSPELNALSTLMIGIASVSIIFGFIVLRRSETTSVTSVQQGPEFTEHIHKADIKNTP